MVNESGIIVPSTEDLNQAIAKLLDGLQNDENVNVHFRVSPVDYFRAIGIATDGIPEIMKELGLQAEAAYAMTCLFTCIYTSGCLMTTWYSNSISVTAKANPLRQQA